MNIFSNIRKRTAAMVLIVATAAAASAQINTDQVLRVGRNALYFEDYMLSIQYFNRVIDAKPYLAEPYFLRAIAKYNLEDYAGAETDASQAITLNPFITDAWEVRGVARQNLGRDADAIGDYEHALQLLPRNRNLLFNLAMAQQGAERTQAADSTFATLLQYYPNYDNAYLGRAQLRLQTADTTGAASDIERALKINPNALNGYILRADMAIRSGGDFKAALADLNEAVRLQPRMAGLYINRAYLRYSLNDYFGAMADYDYALQLEPANATALFNRGLLLAEVNANDRALEDFTSVLNLEPDNYRALYSRALIHRAKGNYRAAIDDVNRVAEAFPDFPDALWLRSDIERSMGNIGKNEATYNQVRRLAEAAKPADKAETEKKAVASSDVPEELVSRRFASLLTVDDNADIHEQYNNSAIRGRVQDRNVAIDIEPMMELGFYSAPSELRSNTYYIKEIDDLNATRALRYAVVVTNRAPALDEDIIKRHFNSIDYYNSLLATHTPRAVDYIGRALDFVTTRNYAAAIDDINRAIALMPDFAPAYWLRAQARYHKLQVDRDTPDAAIDPAARLQVAEATMAEILADIDKGIELSPLTAVAWFNKGNLLLENHDYTSAISAYSRAIEIKPDMGEAYYNRGYIYLKLGNRQAGIADLSKAGEAGIVPAYNLIKRIRK
ncbi:MAG: tetratricopeptide repeat protein [Muribaculaceae bacterium]|nr:tetratricopeptide repeat protein [Muribaculaceae bacterium]